jgi:hypothetical protein
MPTIQTARKCRAPITVRLGLVLVAMAGAVGGCDPTPAANAGSCRTTASLQSPSATAAWGAPLTRLLLTAKASTRSSEVEAFYKSQILPSVIKDGRVANVVTFFDSSEGAPVYVVQLDLKTSDEPSRSLAIDILSPGRGPEAAEKLVDQLTSYFDLKSAKTLTLRPDLSLSRHIAGSGARP